MIEYDITYDVSALVIMLMFSAFYYTRKRYMDGRNKMFNCLMGLVIGSITLDLLSVFVMDRAVIMPVFILYAVNILYFFVTGIMSVFFCIYSLNQTRSDSMIRGSFIRMGLFSLPFGFFSISLFSTPWSHLVFYFDNGGNYLHGIFMDTMLIIVVLYLMFSFVCMTVNNDEVSLKKRLPYYLFMAFMAIAIFIQWITVNYLMYGFAEAIGCVVIYLSNHYSTDMVDYMTELYDRRAFAINLEKLSNSGRDYIILGIGVRDFDNIFDEDSVSKGDILISKIGNFLRANIGDQFSYYLGGASFAVISEYDILKLHNLDTMLHERFTKPWLIDGENRTFEPGFCRLIFPSDAEKPRRLLEMLESGIEISFEFNGRTITKDDLGSAAERKIRKLEYKQKVLEAQFHETEGLMQKAVSADRSKSLFLAQMSHEIRTPMTAILGMTELILRDSDNDKVKQHASAIMSSGKSLIGIINDILDFSKIEAGKLELIDAEYYISSTVNDVIGSIEQRISDKRLDFSVDFDGSIPAVLYGDEIRVKQIIINLLTNACKYTEQGSILLKLGWEKKNEDTAELLIKVKDTGIGIKPENISKLFVGFERFETVRNKSIEGTGLGLAICKQLIETMHGSIDVQSVYGEGSEFSVRLPQKIIDLTPSVHIDEPYRFKALAMVTSRTEASDFKRVFNDLGVTCDYIASDEELGERISDTSYTHIFIPLKEFQKCLTSRPAVISDPRVVVSLYYRQYSANVSGHRTLNMPVFAMNVVSLLTGDSVLDSAIGATAVRNYTAPEANILVVDDNVVNLQIFSGLLECHHFTIDTADSGYKCLKMVRDKRYDIIFLDHMMPRKDGIETLHDMEVDDKSLNRDVPVIAFTANAISGMKEKFTAEGFADFLSKPIDIAKMEDILVKYLPADKVIYFEPEVDESSSTADTQSASESELSFTVDGLDMKKALFYAGGSYKALKSVLEVFLKDGTTKQDLQLELVRNGQFDDYRVEIHAVKSLCKGLGADELSEKARLLEVACKEGDQVYVRANYEEAYSDYTALLDSIDRTLTSLSTASASQTDGQNTSCLTTEEQLICIGALLREFEEEIATRLTADLLTREKNSDLYKKIEHVKDLLDVYDFDAAQKAIEEALG